MVKKVNYDYLRIFLEPFLLFRAIFIKRDKTLKKTRKILIVNPCLVGEFAVSLPAIKNFLMKNHSKVDIVVSPPVKPIAERLKGIRKVFVAKSIYSRCLENIPCPSNKFDEYDKVIVMRISKEAYNLIKNIKTAEIKTSFLNFIKYGWHLIKNNSTNNKIKGWREVNFNMLKLPVKKVKFNDIFKFKKSDYAKLKHLKELKTKSKIVICHTGYGGWPMYNWPTDRWVSLIEKLNKLGKFRFVFIGLKYEKHNFKKIQDKLNFKIYSLIDKVNLLELLLVLKKSDYFIGVDSGPRNLAHLVDLRSVILFGAGPHMYPPPNKRAITIIKGNGIYQRFFYKKNSFVNKISVNEVYRAFKRLLKIRKN